MTINKKRFNIYTICMIALLTAMMVLLKRTIAIETPYIKINFASLPIMLGAMLFGPVEGMVVGLLGELIAQITGPYGLAPTTVLYVAPAAVRGASCGRCGLSCGGLRVIGVQRVNDRRFRHAVVGGNPVFGGNLQQLRFRHAGFEFYHLFYTSLSIVGVFPL